MMSGCNPEVRPGRAVMLNGDARRIPLADKSVQCVVTSPPYFGLRDYGVEGQIGLEPTPEAFVAAMVEVFREVRRVMRDDGTAWVNMGDSYNSSPPGNKNPMSKSGLNGAQTSASYRARLEETQQRQQEGRRLIAGLKPKNRMGIPHMLVFALRADGWYWRDEIVWHKPNAMCESVTDRTTKSHEFMFLLSKRPNYFYDAEAVREEGEGYGRSNWPSQQFKGGDITRHHGGQGGGGTHSYEGGRNKRSVWSISTTPFRGAHFATFPPKLIEPCIMAGTSEKGCCPNCGSPWEREIERNRVATRPGVQSKVYATAPLDPGSPYQTHNGDICGNRDPKRHVTTVKTVGWRPACDCPGFEPVPCRVLDPFGGAGTTPMVARALGRVGIGLELSPDYARLANERLSRAATLQATRPRRRRPRRPAVSGYLFPEMSE